MKGYSSIVRKETSVSAIKQEVRTFCKGDEKGEKASSHLEHTGDVCMIPESYLISEVIEKIEQEIGHGSEIVFTWYHIRRTRPIFCSWIKEGKRQFMC
jgi:hypothetical protein